MTLDSEDTGLTARELLLKTSTAAAHLPKLGVGSAIQLHVSIDVLRELERESGQPATDLGSIASVPAGSWDRLWSLDLNCVSGVRVTFIARHMGGGGPRYMSKQCLHCNGKGCSTCGGHGVTWEEAR